MTIVHEVLIDAKYLEKIQTGEKVIDARVNKPPYDEIKKGDRIKFMVAHDRDQVVFCDVLDIRVYQTFEAMLKAEKVGRCLPGVATVVEGVNLYHSFPNYQRDVKTYKVAAFALKLVDEIKPKKN